MFGTDKNLNVELSYKYLYDIELSYDSRNTHLDMYRTKYYFSETAIKYPIIEIWYKDVMLNQPVNYDVEIIKEILKNNCECPVLKEFLDNPDLLIKFKMDWICPEKCTTIYE